MFFEQLHAILALLGRHAMMLGNQSNSAPCARRPCVASPNHDKYHDLHPKWRPRNYTLLRARVRPQVPFGTNARVVAPLLPAAEATSFMGGRPQKSVAGPILCRQRSKMSGRTTASTGNWFFAPAPPRLRNRVHHLVGWAIYSRPHSCFV